MKELPVMHPDSQLYKILLLKLDKELETTLLVFS